MNISLRFAVLRCKYSIFLLLQIFVGGFLEAIPLCYISIVMPTVLPVDSDLMILLMCSLVLAPAMWQIFKSRSKWKTKGGKVHVIKFVVAAMLALQGLVLISWKVRESVNSSLP